MKVTQYNDGQAFWREVATPLSARALNNNVFIGVADRIRKEIRRDIFRAGVFDGTELALGALRTPPHRLNLAHTGNGDAGVDALVRYLMGAQIAVPGVVAEQCLAERFADRWSKATGQKRQARGHGALQNLYEISRVKAPANAPGVMRAARASERDLIFGWEMAFAVDAGLPVAEREPDYIARFVNEGLADHTFHVWEVHGAPAATARLRPVAGLGARVSGVYTPDDKRGHGYASALTAALSQKVLAGGLWCCLFADADNPLTNRIYQRIGYVKLATFADMMFADP